MDRQERNKFAIDLLHLFGPTPFYVYNSEYYDNYLQLEIGLRGYYTGERKAVYVPWYFKGINIRVFPIGEDKC